MRLGPTHVEVMAAQMLAQDAMDLDPETEWRIVDDSPIVGVMYGDKSAWVPLADHERTRRKKALMTECLMAVAKAMNKLADELEREDSSLTDETRPAPLGD